MKLITRDTDYAIRALCYIAKNINEIISVRELVTKLKIPRPFLRKILQILNKKKLLKSSKGLGGGFVLSVPADKIFLLDLIKVFQGQFKLSECLFKKEVCPHTKICALRRKIDKIEKYVLKELKSVSIAYLLR
jgi:Rrf2 family protein